MTHVTNRVELDFNSIPKYWCRFGNLTSITKVNTISQLKYFYPSLNLINQGLAFIYATFYILVSTNDIDILER
jgi:hypothetical protein